MNFKRTLIIALAVSMLSNCSQAPQSDFKVCRFIDLLKKENILQSPALTSSSREMDLPLLPNSEAITDPFLGENLYNLKKKLALGATEMTVLFSPPQSRYAFDAIAPEEGDLEFGIGIMKNGRSENPKSGNTEAQAGVNFRVSLEFNSRVKTIFRQFLVCPLEEEFALSFHSIKFPRVRKGSRILFETDGERSASAFWSNPILYNRAKKNRHVILISIDTLRADHLGCYGYRRETSPALDALVRDSALFLNVYAPSPWTFPSHVSLLTSLSGVRHQVYHENERMAASVITLADRLRGHNFLTSAITGGGLVGFSLGFSKGFDSYQEAGGEGFNPDAAEWTCRLVSGWLERNVRKDFFLFVHTYQPHDPYSCADPYSRMFLSENSLWGSMNLMHYLGGFAGIYKQLTEPERQNLIDLYDAEIRYTDEALIKPLLAKLKELDLYDSTLIVFTSDHGEEFFEHGSWLHGSQLYDAVLKVPLIIKFPRSEFRGRKTDQTVRLIDVLPTILQTMSIPYGQSDIDGRSLLPVLRGKEKEDRMVLADVGDNILNSHLKKRIALKVNKYKLILNNPFSAEELSFFTAEPPLEPPLELFDLRNDPGENKNIIDQKPDIAKQLIDQVTEVYRTAKKYKPVKAQVDERLKEQLKALGYIR